MGSSGANRSVDTSPVIWTPSDATGATDMTSELEAYATAHPGKYVKCAEGSTIKLLNAFGAKTTGDILLDFTGCTVVYDAGDAQSWAIKADDTANASAEVAVSGIATATVHTDATVSEVTLGTTLAAKRFQWAAIYSTDANPAKAGGQLGEMCQLLDDEGTAGDKILTMTRVLNRAASYTTNVKCRLLGGTRKVHIRGGVWKASGNTEDHAITARPGCIAVIGFVDPLVEDVTFDHPWSLGLRFWSCAAPKSRNITLRDVGNLGNYEGYTYGVQIYAMCDSADIRNTVSRNGRHSAVTTDGNSSGSSTWYAKGIPTNCLIEGVHGYNTHGSVADTHEEGDNIVFRNIVSMNSREDADIDPNFRGLAVQIRAANCTVDGLYVYGDTRGVNVGNIDHGFQDTVTLRNLHFRSLCATIGGSPDQDVCVQINDMSAQTNKRQVVISTMSADDCGKLITVGKTAKCRVAGLTARRIDMIADVAAGATLEFVGDVSIDYRDNTRTASYFGVLARSSVAQGGSTVIFNRAPVISRGAGGTPAVLITEQDTTVAKTVYAPGIIEYNPLSLTPMAAYTTTATTFTIANVTTPAACIPVSKSIVVTAPAAASYVVWRAPYACTVTAVRGYRVGGTGATINAQNAGADLIAVDLSLTSADTWMSQTTIQNAAVAAGAALALEIASVAGSPTVLTIQVDLTTV